MAKLHSPICSTFEVLLVQHAVSVVMEKNCVLSVDQCQLQVLQFSVHLIDLLSILLKCNGFAGIQKAVVYQMGEGNGIPLQYSCLENPMDGGAWWAAVHGVANSWTWLSGFTFTFHFHALEKEMATHSNVLAWRIPGTREPGGLPSMQSNRVGQDWSNLAAAAPVYQMVSRPPDSDHDLFGVQVWFWEVLWSFFSVQPLSWSLPVVV